MIKRLKDILLGVAVAALLLPVVAFAARTTIDWVNQSGTTYLQTNFPGGLDLLINGSNRYINFNAVTGSSGYGFRDNGGTLEFKNSGGSWAGFGTGSGAVTSIIAGNNITVSGATGDVTISGLGYPFALSGNATSTKTQFNGGLTAFSTSTIGDGTQVGGLTISGGATTTGNALVQGTLTTSGRATVNGLTVSNVTGSTQCLHVDTNGVVTGTSGDCGVAGAGIQSLTNTYGTQQVGNNQVLATSSPDTNLGMTITSGSNIHTFTPYWIGTLADNRITSSATWNAKVGPSIFTYPTYGGSATSSLLTLSGGFLDTAASSTINGNLLITGNSTTTSATTTNLFSTTASSTNLFASQATIGNAFTINTSGVVTAGTWNGTVIGTSYGGAGTVNGILKANGSGLVSLASNGTDYSLITAKTCNTGDFVSAVIASGTFTCTTPAANGGGGDSFTHTSVFGQTTSATSTLIALTGSPVSLAASSTVRIGTAGNEFIIDSLGHSTSTNATTTNMFSTTASSTNLFGQLINGFGLTSCNGTNALGWSGGSFSCVAVPQGTVTAVSVASANGFAGSSSGGATPALTLTTTITGLLKGNGTAISAATAGIDYLASYDNFPTHTSVFGQTTSGTSTLIALTGSPNSLVASSSVHIGTAGNEFFIDSLGHSTSTNATTTNFFSTTASSTNLFGQLINGFGLTTCTGTNALTWTGGSFTCTAQPQGTVTAVSVASANGFAGSSGGGATPALTLTTSVTGLLKGNGTAISAAALTDFPAQAANTVIANATGVSAVPTAVATSSLGIALSDTTGVLGPTRGGTNQSTYTTGDILYSSNTNTLSKLGIGTGGFVLASSNGIPSWVSTSSITAAPAGANTQLQFNDSSVFAGAATAIWDKVNGYLGLATSTPKATLSVGSTISYSLASTSVWAVAGSYTYTPPANTVYAVVYMWGGGAAGGTSGGGMAAGGGAGAYITGTINSPSTLTFNVAGGGTGGTGFKTGGNGASGGGGGGGSSKFSTLIACGGGGGAPDNASGGGAGASGTSGGAGDSGNSGAGGGGGCNTNGSNGSGTTGGAGGTGGTSATGTNGTGGSANGGAQRGGGGGSSAGASGNGANGTNQGVGGAGSGGAAGGVLGNPGTAGTAGNTTNHDSGGGGGGANVNGGSAGIGASPGAGGGGSGVGSGGNGAPGMVIILSYSATQVAAIQTGNATTSVVITNLGYIGVGTTSPSAAITTSSSGIVAFLVDMVIGVTHYFVEQINSVGHLVTGGPAPTCGTGCTTVVGDDRNMRVVTSSSVSSATVNFANSYTTTPVCIASEESAGVIVADASSTPTTVVLEFASALTSIRIAVHCEISSNFTY